MFISTPKDFQCLFDGQKWSAAYVAVDTLCENKKFSLSRWKGTIGPSASRRPRSTGSSDIHLRLV